MNLPVVDIAPLFGTDGAARAAVADQIGAACRRDGFFYVTSHGGETLFPALEAESERFFALPIAERMADEVLSLPQGPHLSLDEVAKVIACIASNV